MKVFACWLAVFALIAVSFGQDLPLEFGKPAIIGGVQVIPILATQETNTGEVISLVAAAKKGLVEIYDSKRGGSFVEVRNNAKVPLVLLSGELIVGGHQDQIIHDDVALQPGQQALVAVFCVEAGRSSGQSAAFRAGDYLVPDRFRLIAIAGHGGRGTIGAQNRIWAEVARLNASRDKRPPTGTIQATLGDIELNDSIADLVAKIQPAVDDSARTVGMMFCLNGKIFSADLFASHAIYDQYRSELFRTYALSALVERVSPGVLDAELCQAFLAEVCGAQRIGVRADATGYLLALGGNALESAELVLPGFSRGGVFQPGFVHGLYIPKG
jgi:hypothetical protein